VRCARWQERADERRRHRAPLYVGPKRKGREGTVPINNQLHAETGVLDSTAVTATTTADSIEAHRAALQPVVAGMRAGWDGLAPPMFEGAHTNWEAGITRLVTALRDLGDNTRVVSASYTATDEAAAANLGALQNGGAFGNALAG
jgi:WXG100 family type VII secretion target